MVWKYNTSHEDHYTFSNIPPSIACSASFPLLSICTVFSQLSLASYFWQNVIYHVKYTRTSLFIKCVCVCISIFVISTEWLSNGLCLPKNCMQLSCNSTCYTIHPILSFFFNFKRRVKSHLPFAGIIRSSPYSTR